MAVISISIIIATARMSSVILTTPILITINSENRLDKRVRNYRSNECQIISTPILTTAMMRIVDIRVESMEPMTQNFPATMTAL